MISKNEKLSLMGKLYTLESYVQNKDQRLNDSMKALELYAGQEIQALQKAVVRRVEMIEEIIRTDAQGEGIRIRFSLSSMCQSQMI